MKSKALHGPSMGYGTDEKNAFRQWVWGQIGGRLMYRNGELVPESEQVSHTCDVLLMPSIEGFEITEAYNRGFRPEQLHVVDKSPAVVASLQRRFPGINTYGVSVERACQRIARNGVVLGAANIDFCGSFSRPLFRIIRDCWASGALDSAFVFFTFLRGREDKYERAFAPPSSEFWMAKERLPIEKYWIANDDILMPTDGDWWRISMLVRAASEKGRCWTEARPYISPNGQSFLTVSFPEPKRLANDKEVEVGSYPGDPPPNRKRGESWSQYRSRLTVAQRHRIAALAYELGITDVSVFNLMTEREAA